MDVIANVPLQKYETGSEPEQYFHGPTGRMFHWILGLFEVELKCFYEFSYPHKFIKKKSPINLKKIVV